MLEESHTLSEHTFEATGAVSIPKGSISESAVMDEARTVIEPEIEASGAVSFSKQFPKETAEQAI